MSVFDVRHDHATVPSALEQHLHEDTIDGSTPRIHPERRDPEAHTQMVRNPIEYLPGGRKSLSGISIHAFGLGVVFGWCTIIAIQLLYLGHYLWRLPFFMAVLCVFHYLEFDITARYNPNDARISSFLLFTNGTAYNVAHTMAMLETLLRYWLSMALNMPWLTSNFRTTSVVPSTPAGTASVIGIILVAIGQAMRSLAMKQAGSNFNHIVQSVKRDSHILVTSGVYSISRHPAYFGFFWWALGTQLVLGNYLCLAAYAAILWKFFAQRIRHEERHLMQFFGQAYTDYKAKTPVLIPFIR